MAMAIAKVIGAFFEDEILGTCTAYYWGGRWYETPYSELSLYHAKYIVETRMRLKSPCFREWLPGMEPPVDPETGVIFYVEYQPTVYQALRDLGRAAQAIGGV